MPFRRLILAVVVCYCSFAAGNEPRRPNVLFIAVDDLNCAMGCYGHPVVKTPHIDALARSGVLFSRAYCQIPLCNPSRASLLTGCRPDVTRVYDLDRHFRDELPKAVTLPQLFRQNNYVVARIGKIFHYDVPRGIGTDGLDDAPSWDETINPVGRDVREEHKIINAEPHRPISAVLSWLAAEGNDDEQTDGMITDQAIAWLEKQRDKPFFLGVGFFRPHTPYVAPKSYFQMYPLERIRLPEATPNDRDDIPKGAFPHNCQVPNYGLPSETCRQALQAYYASVSFVDTQIGRLMAALKRLKLEQETIVVFWSDHGYHLGEHNGLWQKRTLFEESARAPLILRSPGAKGNGMPCKRIVEFVDIYPTVADLCGFKPPKRLDGISLRPLLEQPDRPWDRPAFTQILRPGEGKPFMGRSIRTERWRYTEWGSGGAELYDHRTDPKEETNLIDDQRWKDVIHKLKKQLDNHIELQSPKTPFNPTRL
jgi:iduronate 2-sulfatase